MTEQDKKYIETVKKLYSGQSSEESILSPDIIWHVPGHNPVSGDYQGIIEYTEKMTARMQPLDAWNFELENVMVNRLYVVTTFRVHGIRKDKEIHITGSHILRMNADGFIVEGWGFTNDQDALDEFFSA